MTFIVRAAGSSRASSHDSADVFARGDVAVLTIADGAGGMGGAATASAALLDSVREAVLDDAFDLLAPRSWEELLRRFDVSLARARGGETTAVVVVVSPSRVVCARAGDSEAWIVGPTDAIALADDATKTRLGSGRAAPRAVAHGPLGGRLVVATDGLFAVVPHDVILSLVRTSRFGDVADALVRAAQTPAGRWVDDVAVLVAEPS